MLPSITDTRKVVPLKFTGKCLTRLLSPLLAEANTHPEPHLCQGPQPRPLIGTPEVKSPPEPNKVVHVTTVGPAHC